MDTGHEPPPTAGGRPAVVVDLARAGFTDASEIGRGGFGVVFRCRQEELNRTVAVKLLHTDLDQVNRERFLREGRAMGGLSGHPNVVDVLQVGVTGSGRPFIVMPFHALDSLAAHVRREGPVPWAPALRLGVRLAGALESAHRLGTLHRDIKPGNVLLSDYGEPLLTDFGIARIEGGFETATGAFTGSLSYSAPEVLNGRPPTARSDVYGLGATIFSVIAGRAAFERREGEEIIAQFLRITGQPIPDLRGHGIPDGLCTVIEHAMAKDPEQRPASAEMFGRQLQQVQAATGQPVAEMALPAVRRPLPGLDETEIAPAPDERSPDRSVSRSFNLVERPWGPATTGGAVATTSVGGAAGPAVDAATQVVPPPSYSGHHTGPPATLHPPSGQAGFPLVPRPPAGDGPPPAPPATSRTPGGPRGRRRRVIVAVVTAVVLLGGLAIGGTQLVRGLTAPPPTHSGQGLAGPPGVEGWKALPDTPTARQQVATTIDNGVVWVVGGLTDGAATAAVEGYDPAINTWKQAPPLPTPLHHAMAVTYHDEVVVLGGWQPQGGNLSAVVSGKVHAQRGDTWADLPALLIPRAAGAAVAIGDRIVVAGGQNDGQLVPTTEIFDGRRWTKGPDLPTPREHLAMVTDGKYAYAIGGRNLSSDKNTAAVERYDPEKNVWQALAALPTPRGGTAAAYTADGRIVVAGGEDPAAVIGRVDAYDVAANVWAPLPAMRTPRHGLALAAIGSTLYAFDGAAKPSHESSTAVAESIVLAPRRLQPAAAWRAVGDAPVARQFTGSAVVDGRFWVVGGLTANEASAAVWGYDAAINRWTAGPDLPIPLHHTMAVSFHDELWVLGGWTPAGGNPSGANSDRVFALENGTWVEKPRLLRPRVAAAAAVVGGRIVVFGGQTNGQLTAQTDVFDGTGWSEAAPIPTPREHVAGSTDGTYVYAAGGRNLSSSKNSAAFERFDPATNTWATLPPMPTARGGLGVACLDGRIIAIGGEEPTSVLGTVEAYDLATGMWSALAPLGVPRHGMAFATVGDSVVAVGGAQKPTHAESTAQAEALDFQ